MTEPTRPFADPIVELIRIAGVLEIAARHLRALAAAATPPLKRVCSWCTTVISDGVLPATHVICPMCAAKLEAGFKPSGG